MRVITWLYRENCLQTHFRIHRVEHCWGRALRCSWICWFASLKRLSTLSKEVLMDWKEKMEGKREKCDKECKVYLHCFRSQAVLAGKCWWTCFWLHMGRTEEAYKMCLENWKLIMRKLSEDGCEGWKIWAAVDIFLASAVAGFLLHISEIDGMRCRELKYCSLNCWTCTTTSANVGIEDLLCCMAECVWGCGKFRFKLALCSSK